MEGRNMVEIYLIMRDIRRCWKRGLTPEETCEETGMSLSVIKDLYDEWEKNND